MKDVKWSHGPFDRKIATAAANGQIVVYDLERAGVELARLHEHNRQVHRLDFNPHQGAWMLSGSQDSTIRLWDLRALAGDRNVMTCQSQSQFPGNSEGVRDVRWSPTNGVEFAIGTDGGVIQRWDIRKANAPLLKIAAHDKTCNTIGWHPDGKHLVSGGADKNVKVWDFASSDRRMKPMWQLRAPQAVVNVRWRPGCWSSRGVGNWQCTQLATSYDKEDPRIHIWDFRRPSVPFRVLDRYETPPTSLLWRSESLLWAVGSAGMFTQTDITSLPKVSDYRNPNTLGIAADGRITFTSMKGERRKPSIEDVTQEMLQQGHRGESTNARPSGSNSTTEPGSLDDFSPLHSSLRSRRGKQPGSSRSAASLSSTPSSGEPVDQLDISLQTKNLYKPPQLIGTGYVPGVFDAEGFRFMARHYTAPPILSPGQSGNSLHQIFSLVFQHNARVAAFAGQHRLSQTWKILGLAVERELLKRAEHNRKQRQLAASTEASNGPLLSPTSSKKLRVTGNDHERMSSISDRELQQATNVLARLDTSSNMTTPLARPIINYTDTSNGRTTTTALEKVDHLQLPESPWAKQSPKPTPGVSELKRLASPRSLSGGKENTRGYGHISGSEESESSTSPSPRDRKEIIPTMRFADLDRDMAKRRAAAGNYRAMPRPLFELDDPFQMNRTSPSMPPLDRQDSNDSFQMFSTSTDSSQRGASKNGSLDSFRESEKSGSTPDQLKTYDRRRSSNYDGDTGDAGIFDDEAEMISSNTRTPFPTSVSSNEIRGNVPLSASTSIPSLRPPKAMPAIVNAEDVESWGGVHVLGGDRADEEQSYVEADFFPTLPVEGDTPPPPWTATAIILPLIEYHCEKLFDTQFPTYLLLHVAPYFPTRMHRERALGIISQYHHQLQIFDLHVQAAELRNQAMEYYPELSECGLHQVDTGGPWCTNCNKPSKGSKPKQCERCNKPWGECPICNGDGPISPDRPTGIDIIASPRATNAKTGDALWSWCQYCGHGGHAGCLRTWWTDPASEGGCPIMGCLCDCMPGSRRDEINTATEADWRREKSAVHRDDWSVGESAAAQRASRLVGSDVGRGGRGILHGRGEGGPLSLGAAGRSASGGKKVRIVVPEDEVGVGRGDGRRVDGGKEGGRVDGGGGGGKRE